MSKVKLMLLSVFAVLAMGAVASSSASATVFHFDVCEEVSTTASTNYTSLATCVASGVPSGGKWTKYKIPTGTSLKVDSKTGAEKFVLKTKALTLTVKIECTNETDRGTAENPAGGGAGKDKEVIEFTGCTVPEPTGLGCKVKEPIVASAITELVEFSGKAADEFKPEVTGGNFTEVTLVGCSNAELNKTFPVKGTDTGIGLNATSELEFTVASSGLTFGGEPASLKGKASVLMEGNGADLLILP